MTDRYSCVDGTWLFEVEIEKGGKLYVIEGKLHSSLVFGPGTLADNPGFSGGPVPSEGFSEGCEWSGFE